MTDRFTTYVFFLYMRDLLSFSGLAKTLMDTDNEGIRKKTTLKSQPTP